MSNYFKSRSEAGQRLAEELIKYRYENCIVLALSDGAVQVGEQIAMQLHCILTMVLLENIEVPGESISFGMVNQSGGFSLNGEMSSGEAEAYYDEFHGYIDDQKRTKFQKINRLLSDGGIVTNDMLRDHVVIVVADGLPDGTLITAAAEFLKPIRLEKLIMAAPIVSVEAVDKMHVLADELHVLGVTDNFLGVDHYYEENNILTHEETIKKINQIILNWQ